MTTFNDCPHDSNGKFEGGQSDVCFLGVPYDGMASGPSGQREGPLAIRRAGEWEQDQLFDSYRKTPEATTRYVDAGDVVITPGDDATSIADISDAAEDIMHNTRRLVTFGGDNSVSKHIIEGLSRVIDTPHLVLFDAHTDCSPADYSDHGTWVRELIEEGKISGASIFGTRGYMSNNQLVWASQNNVQITPVSEFLGPQPTTRLIRQAAGRNSIYLAVDLDVLDPSYAPGTGFPEPGGLTSRELLHTVHDVLDNFDVPAMDITELLPLKDQSEITAKIASRIAVSALFL